MILNRKFSAFLLMILFTYVNNPFYFAVITPIHKAFYYGIALLPIFFALQKGFRYGRNFGSYAKLFLLYFISIFLVMLFSYSLDFQYLNYFVRLFVGLCASLSVFCIWKYERNIGHIYEDFEIIYVKSVAFYIFGTIAFITIPPLKTLWQSLIVDFGEKDFSDFVEYITRFGFAGFSGFGCAFMVSAASVIMSYLFLNKKISLKKCRFYSVVFIIGSFFYGRIGFVVSLFVCGMLAFYLFFHKRPKLLRFYILIVAVLILIGFILYFTIPDIQPFIDWLLEPVFNFIKKGKFESASTNDLGNMYKNFSPSDKTLAIGDGHWIGIDGTGYYGHTDVGFMRNILFGGFFYCILLYSLIAFFLFFLYQSLKANRKKGAGFLTFLIFVQFMLFELKGDITFLFLKAYIPFYVYLIYEKNKDSRKKLLIF